MEEAARLMRFVLELRQAGVTDPRVLSALERTSRAHYAPDHLAGLGFDDINLPLPLGEFMTKPSMVGRMLTALAPREGDVVLEIGTGSGFQAAAIARLAHKVVTLERRRSLAVEARGNLGKARLMRVFVHAADGFDGWPDDAPYDRIILNVAVTGEIPAALLSQLKPGGVLLTPMEINGVQRLVRYRDGHTEDLGPAAFPPLERGVDDQDAPPAGAFDSGGDSPSN